MTTDLCQVCGAYWQCDHRDNAERDKLRYVPPDGPTYREREAVRREALHHLASTIGRSSDALRRLSEAIRHIDGGVEG